MEKASNAVSTIIAFVAALLVIAGIFIGFNEMGVTQMLLNSGHPAGESAGGVLAGAYKFVQGFVTGFFQGVGFQFSMPGISIGGPPSPSSYQVATPIPGYYGPSVVGPSGAGEVGPSGVSAEQEAETRAQTALNLLSACNATEAMEVAKAAIGYDPANQAALEVQAAASSLVSLFTQLAAATTPATRGAVAAQILDFEFQGQQPCAENPLAKSAKSQAEIGVTAQQQAEEAALRHQLALQEFSAWLAASDFAPTGPNLGDHRWKEPAGPPADQESLSKLAGKNLVIKRTNAPGLVGITRDSDVYAGDVVDPTTGTVVGSFVVTRKWLRDYTTWTGGSVGSSFQIKGVSPWPWGQQSLAPPAPGARGPSAVATPTKTTAAPAAGLPPAEEEEAPPALPPAITSTPVPTVVIRALAPECAEVPNRATVDGTRPNCRRVLLLNPTQLESRQVVLADGHEVLFGEAYPGVVIDGVSHTYVWTFWPKLGKQGWADYACLVPQGPITAGCKAPAPTPTPTPVFRWIPGPSFFGP